TVRAFVSVIVLGMLLAGIIILFVVVWRRVNRDKVPGLYANAGVRVK
ncbi:hypothetical protein HYW75_04700, partial [Candidatus Pacearchaeota archaeon]|nr:hypothetical protein [Candidatus Pacearchaeota archaeon]MBI2632278.1 hypothetical protein [Candidatus Pacearchaeota archaeon]